LQSFWKAGSARKGFLKVEIPDSEAFISLG
jgi:hypothetical protein